jgi:TolB-like protein/Flp pilus assembly protein TadD
MTPDQFAFGDFVLDAARRQVRRRDGVLVPLTPRLFNALHLFVTRPGELLDKDELLRELWPGLVVEENSVSQVISSLRRCLGEDGDQKRYIHTEPRRGFRFVATVTGQAPTTTGGLGTALASRSTLAVLPFQNLSPRPADDLLPVGMADSLISRLSTWPHLVVRSVSSVRRFDGARQDPIQVGRMLGVDWVVEGSLQYAGQQVRVAARLLSVADGSAAWSERFDEEFLGVFDVQDLIADRVAQALARHLPQLLPLESSVGLHRLGNTRNFDAYQLYLAGHLHAQSLRADGLQRSVGLFQQALALDPGYALAHVGIAESYRRMIFGADGAPREVFGPARQAVLSALAIAPQLAEAHAQLAWLRYWDDFDWPEAERVFRHALGLNPNVVGAHFGLGFLLLTLGSLDEGLRHVQTARELDPMSLLINVMEATFLFRKGQRHAASERLSRVLAIEPGFWIGHMAQAAVHIADGLFEHAIAALQRADALADQSTQPAALLGRQLALAAKRDDARAILTRLQVLAGTRYVPPTSLATVHAALGETAQALDALEQAYALRDTRLVYMKDDTRWTELRAEPRFGELLRKMKLDAYGPGIIGP